MEIRVLKYFLTIVREGRMNKAAEILHITQPTLSRQIAQLERDLGVLLFERGAGARNLKLTSEGLLFRRRAEEIISLVDRTEKELLEQEAIVEGKIVIGGGELLAMDTLATIMKKFHAKYPKVKFDIITGNADYIKEQMEKGLIDIGVLLEPIDMEKFDFVRLKEVERWVVAMKPEDTLSAKKTIEAKDLVGFPLTLPFRLNVQNEVKNWLGEYESQMDILCTSNLGSNGARMVSHGLARFILVEGGVSMCDKEQVVYRPLQPELRANSVFAWKKGMPLHLAVEKFIEEIVSEVDGR